MTLRPNMQIAVLGAGIAGAACALALTRQGHRVDVYERRAGAGTLGAGLVLWSNATAVLEAWGLLEAIRPLSGRPGAMRRLSATGEPLGALDARTIDAQLGSPSCAILRADLQRVLLDALAQAAVRIHFGHNATHIDDNEAGPATVHFTHGAAITADLVIGADGRMDSAARRFVAPGQRPVYQGFVNQVGISRLTRPLKHPGDILDVWGTNTRFGVVPVADDMVYWAAGMAHPTGEPDGPGDLLPALAQRFAGWPDDVHHTLATADPASVRHIAVYDIDPLSAWHRGKVVLVGDAAHAALPTSGQGACQAIEDAWHLAHCLAPEGGSIDASLVQFRDRRFDKTNRITMAARQFAQALFNNADPGQCARRNAESAAADHHAAAIGMGRFWAAGLEALARPAE